MVVLPTHSSRTAADPTVFQHSVRARRENGRVLLCTLECE